MGCMHLLGLAVTVVLLCQNGILVFVHFQLFTMAIRALRTVSGRYNYYIFVCLWKQGRHSILLWASQELQGQ